MAFPFESPSAGVALVGLKINKSLKWINKVLTIIERILLGEFFYYLPPI